MLKQTNFFKFIFYTSCNFFGIVILLVAFSIIHPTNQIFAQSSHYISREISEINLDDPPRDIILNPETNKIFVTYPSRNVISVIDGKTNEISANITLDNFPYDITVNPKTNTVYTVTKHSGNVSVIIIDGKTNKISANISMNSQVEQITVNPKTNTVYTVTESPGIVSVIDGKTNKISANITLDHKIKLGHKFKGIILNSETNTFYVYSSTGIMYVVDGNTNEISKIKVDGIVLDMKINPITNKIYIKFPFAKIGVIDTENNKVNFIYNKYYLGDAKISINEKTNTIYVLNLKDNILSAIDGKTDKVTNTISVGKDTRDIEINPTTDKIYVTDFPTKILVIDGEKILEGFYSKQKLIYPKIQLYSEVLTLDPKTNTIYTVDSIFGDISRIDGKTNKITNNITKYVFDGGIAVNPNSNTLYVGNSTSIYAINTKTNKITNNISINFYPYLIAVNPKTNTLYSTDYASNNIYSIDTTINKIIKKISVGNHNEITSIAINPDTNTIYYGTKSGIVSVIERMENRISNNITVGNHNEITSIAINPDTNIIYVLMADAISVIDGETNKVLTLIPLDDIAYYASTVAVNPKTNTLYVLDYEGLTLIDSKLNRVLLPKNVTFTINPSNSGNIKCDNNEVIFNQSFRLPFDSLCIAEPRNGFEFVDWVENLDDVSLMNVKKIKVSEDLNPIVVTFTSFLNLLGIKLGNTEATFSVRESGNYTANFEEIPPPIPKEYVAALFGIVATTIIGWSIPSIIGWIRIKNDIRKLNYFRHRIKNLYNDGKLNEGDLKNLDLIRNDIIDSYSKGKLNNEHYTNIKNEISIIYEEIFSKRIDYLDNVSSNEVKLNKIAQIKNDIIDAYSKGKLIDLHYNILKEKISDSEN